MKQTGEVRGFAVYEFKDSYGAKCSLQESSAATLGHIWLGMTEWSDGQPVGIKDKVTGHHTGARMHLSRAQVAELIPMLQHFVEHGTLASVPQIEKPLVGLLRDVLETAMQEMIDNVEDILG